MRTLSEGDILHLCPEPANTADSFAVAVIIVDTNDIIGHVPALFNRVVFFFQGTAILVTEVTGDRVNRGLGLGLEVLCTYPLHGRKL